MSLGVAKILPALGIAFFWIAKANAGDRHIAMRASPVQ
jgi:hypothetical protein